MAVSLKCGHSKQLSQHSTSKFSCIIPHVNLIVRYLFQSIDECIVVQTIFSHF